MWITLQKFYKQKHFIYLESRLRYLVHSEIHSEEPLLSFGVNFNFWSYWYNSYETIGFAFYVWTYCSRYFSLQKWTKNKFWKIKHLFKVFRMNKTIPVETVRYRNLLLWFFAFLNKKWIWPNKEIENAGKIVQFAPLKSTKDFSLWSIKISEFMKNLLKIYSCYTEMSSK